MEGPLKIFVLEQLGRAQEAVAAILADSDLHGVLTAAAEATAQSMLKSGKLMIAGNGGSAADAQHLVAEFVSRLTVDRPAMRAVALTTDTSILTAIGNDFGYQHVFMRQVEALGQKEDVFLGISTSGKSENVILALTKARAMGLQTIGLCGDHTKTMAPLCDYLLSVQSSITQNIQECHLVLEHIFCGLVERFYFGPNFPANLASLQESVRS
jgi:D-sedoheptulose 7-phosphate isomerase